MNDLGFLLDYIDLVTLGICLCIGFALKYANIFERFGNHYIPLSMLILGCTIAIIINIGNVNAAVILGGMISGLASTGLYEMIRNLLNFDGKKEE
ncbi:MAG: phage holin family protein [Acetivibrio ethanolgignens]